MRLALQRAVAAVLLWTLFVVLGIATLNSYTERSASVAVLDFVEVLHNRERMVRSANRPIVVAAPRRAGAWRSA